MGRLVAFAAYGVFIATVLLAVGGAPPVGADPPFSTNVRVNPDITPAQAANPSLTIGPDGTVYAAWQDDRNGDWDIWFAKSSDGGSTWTDPSVRVDSAPAPAFAGAPLIARGPTGNLYIVWQDDRNGDLDIYFDTSSDDGVTWMASDVRINTDATTASQHQQTIAVDANDNVYVAWVDFRSGTAQVYFAASADAGTTWTDPNIRIGEDTTPRSASLPFLAVDGLGTLYALWTDDRNGDLDVWFARSEDGGGTWTSGDQRVNTDAGSAWQSRVALATGPGNALYVVWQDNRSGDYDIYFASSMDGGDTWTHPNVRVDGDPGNAAQESPELAVDPVAGHLYVVWHDERNGDRDIYLARSRDGGLTWFNPNVRVNDDATATRQWFPRISVDLISRRVYAIWSDARSGGNDAFLAYLPPNDPPSIAATPAPPASATVGVHLSFTFTATDPDGDPLAWRKVSGPAWLEVGAANGTIYGTPTAADVGTNTFILEVADDVAGSDRITFSINVTFPPAAPEGLPLWVWGSLLAAIVLAAILAVVFLRRRRRPIPPSPPTP